MLAAVIQAGRDQRAVVGIAGGPRAVAAAATVDERDTTSTPSCTISNLRVTMWLATRRHYPEAGRI